MPDIALLYSGGLDSYVAWRLARAENLDVLPVWVDLGHPYAAQEREAHYTTGVTPVEVPCPVVLAPGHLGQLPGGVIPGRNLLLATIAAGFAPTVWLCAVHGEMHPYANRDKSTEWYLATSAQLTYSFLPARSRTVVETPFADRTKTEVVRLALDIGVTPDELRATSTCYTPVYGTACGDCVACFHRWIAFTNNDLTEPYAANPARSRFAAIDLVKMAEAERAGDTTHYPPRRIAETRAALRREHLDVG